MTHRIIIPRNSSAIRFTTCRTLGHRILGHRILGHPTLGTRTLGTRSPFTNFVHKNPSTNRIRPSFFSIYPH